MNLSLKNLEDVNIDILTKREREKCTEAFLAFDKNGSKMIEKEELKLALIGTLTSNKFKISLEMGLDPTEEDLIKMIT